MQREIDMLEQDLIRLSEATSYPATPDFGSAVRRRLAAGPQVRRVGSMRPAAVAAAAVIAVAVGISAVAPAREAVADLFHRINIFETTQSPAGLPRDITGREVSLQEAQ